MRGCKYNEEEEAARLVSFFMFFEPRQLLNIIVYASSDTSFNIYSRQPERREATLGFFAFSCARRERASERKKVAESREQWRGQFVAECHAESLKGEWKRERWFYFGKGAMRCLDAAE